MSTMIMYGMVYGRLNEADTAKYKSHPGYVKLRDVDKNDKLITDDRQIIGQQDPSLLWGMTNIFTYGNFTLSIFIHGVHGAPVRNYTMNDDVPDPRSGIIPLKKNWWTPTNPTNDWIKNQDWQTIWDQEDLLFMIKLISCVLKDISLSYDLPKSTVSKLVSAS